MSLLHSLIYPSIHPLYARHIHSFIHYMLGVVNTEMSKYYSWFSGEGKNQMENEPASIIHTYVSLACEQKSSSQVFLEASEHTPWKQFSFPSYCEKGDANTRREGEQIAATS